MQTVVKRFESNKMKADLAGMLTRDARGACMRQAA